ncbi:helix-turn-helix domain-containing protein [Conexibacter stalactiti]|uniref:Helix-turn-helix domain-containing protein n=1 Tax=Conexibacter stalactiti TaxID=1940611 RepID=A0ABU4HL52_9ACTN|nr:helix-turn-helix domain-containing protein [Conexibacter stalactiti]MDW5594032.1 helix-turn-helix domain-containing protein [Conexibacter stalactiti]MEC5034674.1 helix-turn-helix domain-containing protein [Conexibacter stalactiti]
MLIGTPTEFGAALERRRRELSLTQDDVASAIGVNRRVIGELERGKGSVRIEIALAVAQAVGLDVDLSART